MDVEKNSKNQDTRNLGEEYSDIDINDIYEMFDDGTLTEEDLAEIGITD